MLFSDHIAKERAEERAEGLRIFIEDKLEDGIDENIIIDKVVRKYQLSREEAQKIVLKETQKFVD